MPILDENIVIQRFRAVYAYLEEQKLIKNKSDLADALQTYNHIIHGILRGDRNLTVEQITKLVEQYPINANYLFGTSNDMNTHHHPTHTTSRRHTTTQHNIRLVPQRAIAGYALSHQDPQFLDDLPRFALPGIEGEHIAFQIDGDSMLPTIANNDLVVCQSLEPNEPLKENHLYIVVTDTVVAKRIQQIKKRNRLAELRLLSDNPLFQPYLVDIADVRQILRVRCRISSSGIM
jgi:hypothetical protein